MYCNYCKKKAMLGATRCSQCGRPLSRGNGPYEQGISGGKIALIAVSVVVVLCLLVVLIIPKESDRGARGDSVSLRGEDKSPRRPGREVIAETTKPDRREDIQRETFPSVPKVTVPEVTEPKTTEPTQTQPTAPKSEEVRKVEGFTIYNFRELKDKLAPECIDEPVEATFQYLGNEGKLGYEDVCHILGARAASVTDLGDGNYRITAAPYAGARILKAYRSGDTSSLSKDELDTLKRAEEIVDRARKEANSDWELELILHDWMCDNISYYDVDFTIEFTEKRPLNVIGALLDGKANCQGYTDCFYLLGSMAGFVVDKQSEVGHTFNTIKLGGKWYIVDVTHDDDVFNGDGIQYHYYQFLNVGHSDSDGRTWKNAIERNPVPAESGSYFYYEQQDLGEEHSYQKVFYSLQDAARSVISEFSGGRMRHHILIRGTNADAEALNSALRQEANARGVTYSLSTWYINNNGNTYFFVVFE